METNQKSSIAIKKATTSLLKVQKMIEEEKYCIDVIQQNLAVIGLLRSANMHLLEGHVHGCLKKALLEKDEKKVDAMLDEISKVLNTAQKK